MTGHPARDTAAPSSANDRPPTLSLGIDVGGTKVAAALVDTGGAVVGRRRQPMAGANNQVALQSVCDVADRLLDEYPGARTHLVGIGVGAAGAVDWRTGTVLGSANLSWRNLPLAAALRERYDLPSLVENDVNAAAWGEYCFGHAPPDSPPTDPTAKAPPFQKSADHVHNSSLVFISAGTGIGAGIVEAGRLVRGRRGAGEIGHIPLDEAGPRCRCGLTGCLEALASGPAFAAAAGALAAAGQAPRLLELCGHDLAALTPSHVVQAAAEGERAASLALDREGYYLALAVVIARRMLDPDIVVVGGGLAEAGFALFSALWTNLARLQGYTGRARRAELERVVVPSRLGADAGAIGAAALLLRPEPGYVAAGLAGGTL